MCCVVYLFIFLKYAVALNEVLELELTFLKNINYDLCFQRSDFSKALKFICSPDTHKRCTHKCGLIIHKNLPLHLLKLFEVVTTPSKSIDKTLPPPISTSISTSISTCLSTSTESLPTMATPIENKNVTKSEDLGNLTFLTVEIGRLK